MTTNLNTAFNKVQANLPEGELANLAMQYWSTVDTYAKMRSDKYWYIPMLAFQMGYVYAKERYGLND